MRKNLESYLKDNLDAFKFEIIDESIDYYGEEYKGEITHRINDINFIFYINEKDKSINHRNRSKNYDKLNCVYKNIKNDINKSQKFKSELSKVENRIIYSNKLDSLNDDDLYMIDSAIKKNRTCFNMGYDEETGEIKRFVIIPIFKSDDVCLIHEIVHSIMSQELMVYRNELLRKCGFISSNHQGETILEETLTEIDAQRIAYRLKERNVDYISKLSLTSKHLCFYNICNEFVLHFYNYFRDDINKARITLDKSELLSKIGNKLYESYITNIKDYYENYYESGYSIYLPSANKNIEGMKKNYLVRKLK